MNGLFKKERRRRIHYILKPFQRTFIIFTIGLLLLSLCISVVWSSIEVRNILDEMLYRSHLPFSSTGDILLPVLTRINIIAACIMLLLGAVILKISFRRYDRYFKWFVRRMEGICQAESESDQTISLFSDIERDLEMLLAEWHRKRKIWTAVEGNLRELGKEYRDGRIAMEDLSEFKRIIEKNRDMLRNSIKGVE